MLSVIFAAVQIDIIHIRAGDSVPADDEAVRALRALLRSARYAEGVGARAALDEDPVFTCDFVGGNGHLIDLGQSVRYGQSILRRFFVMLDGLLFLFALCGRIAYDIFVRAAHGAPAHLDAVLDAFAADIDVAVDDQIRVLQGVVEHIGDKAGDVEIRGVICGHGYAEQGEVAHVDIKIRAVDYHGEQVARLDHDFVLAVLADTHHQILVKGEVEHSQGVFGIVIIEREPERQRKSELHAALSVDRFVLIKRLEDEVETVGVGQAAVNDTEAVEQVADTEHATRQVEIHVEIEREIAEQAHDRLGKRRAAREIEFGDTLTRQIEFFVKRSVAVGIDGELRAERIDILGRRFASERGASYLHIQIERAVHEQQVAARFDKVDLRPEQRLCQLLKNGRMRLERHAQILQAHYLNEISHERSYRHGRNAERRSIRLLVNGLVPIRIVSEVKQLVQIQIYAREQFANFTFGKIHDGRAGHLDDAAAERAVAYRGEIEIDVAFIQINADRGLPLGLAARLHFDADIGVERGEIVGAAVENKVEPIFDVGGRVDVEITGIGVDAFHSEQAEYAVERILQVESFSLAAAAQLESKAAAEHAVQNLVDEVAAVIFKAGRHVGLLVGPVAAHIGDERVAQIVRVFNVALSEARGKREACFKSRAFISAVFDLRVVQAELELVALARVGRELDLPRQVIQSREVDYRRVFQYLRDRAERHGQRQIGAKLERSGRIHRALIALRQGEHSRSLLLGGQLREQFADLIRDHIDDVVEIAHDIEVLHFQHGEFKPQQFDVGKIDIEVALIDRDIDAIALVEYGRRISERERSLSNHAHRECALFKIERAAFIELEIGRQGERKLNIRRVYRPIDALFFERVQSVDDVLIVAVDDVVDYRRDKLPNIRRAARSRHVEIEARVESIEQLDDAAVHVVEIDDDRFQSFDILAQVGSRRSRRLSDLEPEHKLQSRSVIGDGIFDGRFDLALAREDVDMTMRFCVERKRCALHEREQLVDDSLLKVYLDVRIFNGDHRHDSADDVLCRVGSVRGSVAVSARHALNGRERVTERIGPALGDEVEDAAQIHIDLGAVDVKSVDQSAQVCGQLFDRAARLDFDRTHAYARKVEPYAALIDINADQRGGLCRSDIVDLERDHVQIDVALRHLAVERKLEVDPHGLTVKFGDEIERRVAEADQAADKLIHHAEQVEALRLSRFRSQRKRELGGEHLVEYAAEELGGIFVFVYVRDLAEFVLYKFGDGHAVDFAADTDIRGKPEADRLTVERAVEVRPYGLLRSLIRLADADLHVKFHRGDARGNVDHLRKQAEYRLRSHDELQLRRVDIDIVLETTAVCERQSLRAHRGSEGHGARLARSDEFEAVISVAESVESIDGDIVARGGSYVVRAAHGVSGRLFVIYRLRVEQNFRRIFRRRIEIHDLEFGLADIVERYLEIHFVGACGDAALVGKIHHAVVVVIHIGDRLLELHEITFHKFGKVEVVDLVDRQSDAEDRDRAEVDDESVVRHRDSDRGSLSDDKAVARDQLALLSRHAAERNAVGEGDADHEAALIEIALVKVCVNAEVDLDIACVRADGPDEFVTEIIGDTVGQERSDDVDDVIIVRGNVYVQIRLDRDAVGEDTDDALGKSRAV